MIQVSLGGKSDSHSLNDLLLRERLPDESLNQPFFQSCLNSGIVLVEVTGDRVFINLLLNAINAMPNGGTVDVFADRAAD